MKTVFLLLIGVVFVCLGLYWTGSGWYVAGHENKIDATQSYLGPVFLALGLFRILSSASVLERNILFRICAIVIGLLLAAGNHAALKAAYPNAQEVSQTGHTN